MRLSYDDLYSLWVALESPMYSSSDAIAELEREIEDGSSTDTYLDNKRKELRQEKALYKKVMRLRKKLVNEMQRRRTS